MRKKILASLFCLVFLFSIVGTAMAAPQDGFYVNGHRYNLDLSKDDPGYQNYLSDMEAIGWDFTKVIIVSNNKFAPAQAAVDEGDIDPVLQDNAHQQVGGSIPETVESIGNDGKTGPEEPVSTTDKIVTGVAIETAPTKVTYTAGEKLDLTGLVVTLTNSDTTTNDVALKDFATNGISTSPANGATLAETDKTVEIKVNGKTVSQAITVNQATKYALTIAKITGGTATVTTDPANEAAAGATVTVSIANIEAGKQFKSITVTDADSKTVATTTKTAGESYTFTMPVKAVTVAVEVEAIPATKYVLTIAKATGGTATVTTDPANEAAAGATVTVSIANIEAGKQFKSITVTDADSKAVTTTEVKAGENYTFTMPAKAVTVAVEVESAAATPESLITAAINAFVPSDTFKVEFEQSGNVVIDQWGVEASQISITNGLSTIKSSGKNTTFHAKITGSSATEGDRTVPDVASFHELFVGPVDQAVAYVTGGALTEDANNYYIAVTDRNAPDSIKAISRAAAGDASSVTWNSLNLSCKIAISKTSRTVIDVTDFHLVGKGKSSGMAVTMNITGTSTITY